jgi:hypothetical protein
LTILSSLQDLGMFLNLSENLLSTHKFYGLGFCTRIEHEMMEILHDANTIDKGTNMYELYIVYGSPIILSYIFS